MHLVASPFHRFASLSRHLRITSSFLHPPSTLSFSSSSSSDVNLLHISSLLQQRKISEAMQRLNEILSLDETHVMARCLRSTAYQQAREWDPAEKDLEQALVYGRHDDRQRFIVENFRADLFVARGLARNTRDDFERAYRSYQELIDINGKFAPGFVGQAKCSLLMDDISGFAGRLLDAFDANAEDARFVIELSFPRGSMFPTSFSEDLSKLYSTNSVSFKDVVERYTKACTLVPQQQIETALDEISQLITLYPDYSSFLFTRGSIHLLSNHLEDAENDFSSALAISGSHLQSKYQRARARTLLGRWQDAISDYSDVLSLSETTLQKLEDFELSNVLCLRGQVYLQSGDYELSFADFSRAKDLTSYDPLPYASLSRTHLLRGEKKEALELANKAVDISPHAAVGYNTRAVVRASLEDWQGVLEDCMDAVDVTALNEQYTPYALETLPISQRDFLSLAKKIGGDVERKAVSWLEEKKKAALAAAEKTT